MAIYMMGVDHKKADLDIRSRFSFTLKKTEEAYEALKENAMVNGCVLLSTCNRTEFWVHSRKHKEISPSEILCNYMGLSYSEYQPYFIERKNEEAVNHLFRLAAGLESKIVGEGQILTQVGDAIAFARKCYAADNTLEVLFRLAVTAGKRVRTETDLSIADRSVIRTALDRLKEEGFSVKGKKCLVIGNGMMGKLAARVLLEEGASVQVTVRRYHSGYVDIPEGCRAIGYDERYHYLPDADLIVSATASPNFTLTKDKLSELSLPETKTILDLAVPRDVETEVAEIPWVRLFDIDAFHIDVQSDKFKENFSKAEKIIEEVKADFYTWYKGLDYMPILQKLKQKTGQNVVLRMSPELKKIPLDQQEKDQLAAGISAASERMMNHLLFSLKSNLPDSTFREVLDVLSNVMLEDHKNRKGEE